MKNNIYDRIDDIATEDLSLLLAIWNRLIDGRAHTPRHDYFGKCALRATLTLEKRGTLHQPPPLRKTTIRRASQRRSNHV